MSRPLDDGNMTLIARERAEYFGTPDLVIVCEQDGQQSYISAPGRRVENRHYEIGSLTKVLVGLLLCELANQRLIRFEDAISKYLPSPMRAEFAPITLLELGTHTSGLPRLPNNLSPKDPADPYRDYGAKELHDFLATASAGWVIEGRGLFQYSNLGAGLLGHVLERATGQTLDELLERYILKPLGMSATYISRPGELTAPSGQTADGDLAKPWTFDVLAGCGGIVSTIEDMGNFLHSILNPESTSLNAALRESVSVLASPQGQEIGAFWMRLPPDIVWHNGRTYGYSSMAAFHNAERSGAIALCAASISLDDLVLHIVDPEHFSLHALPMEMPSDPKDLAKYVGSYRHSGVEFNISVSGARLLYDVPGRERLLLYPKHATRFFAKSQDFELEFEKNGEGVRAHEYVSGNHMATAVRFDASTESK